MSDRRTGWDTYFDAYNAAYKREHGMTPEEVENPAWQKSSLGGQWRFPPEDMKRHIIVNDFFKDWDAGRQPKDWEGLPPEEVLEVAKKHNLLFDPPPDYGRDLRGLLNPSPREDVNAAQITGGGYQRGSNNVGHTIFKRFQRLQGGDQEVRYARDLPANDPRWEAFAKALGVNVEELKKKNLPSKFDQDYENMAQDMLRRVRERGYGESRLLNEKQFDPNLVPIRAPYGRQRYYDPASALGVDPIMAQGGTGEVRGKEPPFAEGGKWWWERADEQAKLDDKQGRGPEFVGSETPEQMLDRRRRTAYKTVGVNINGEEVEIPIWDENMTPDQAESAARDRLEMNLSPFASDMELEAAQNDNAKQRGYARGTSNVGLGIFKRAQHLAEGGSDIPAPAGIGDIPKPPNLPYIQSGGLFGSNYWPAWVRYGLGALPYVGPALNAARTGYNIYDRIHWAMTQPKLPGGQGGDTGTAPADDGSNVTAPTSNDTPTPGVGIDPTGMPADPGEWWSDDFGRWAGGDKYGTTPGDYWNQGGPGGPAGTRGIGGGGFYRTTIPGGNDQNFMPTLGGAMPAASGGGAYGGNTMAKIAMHGTFKDVATPEQWAFMQNYLQGGQGGGGSGAGVGGAGRPMTQSRQMGTSDVNPGLKLFHAKQLKRKKQ